MSGSVTTGSVEELRTWLTGKVAQYLGVDPAQVDPETSFESQGLDSMAALTMCDEIEDHLQIVVEPTLPWDYPNIVALTAFLHETAASGASSGA